MIPILYKKDNTNYNRNGTGFLTDCISCKVTEERNGAYELSLEYPITGQHYAEIAEGDVIKTKANETSDPQLFRIYSHSKPLNGIVSFNAEHISYDLNGIPLAGLAVTGQTPQAAMTRALQEGAFSADFTAWSDIPTIGNVSLTEPCSVRAALGGQRGSILDVYGGEYEFDNKVIKLHAHRGTDNGVSIEYGKNLTDIRQERNITEIYTHIFPYAVYTDETTSTDVTVTLSEKVIPLTAAENVGHSKAAIINLSDKFAEGEQITEQALRTKATSYAATHSELGTPKVNIKASFVSLWQTEEYKNIAPLERVRLCDTVTIKFTELGVSAKAKAIKTVYDALKEKYESIEIGDARSNFADTVLKQNEAIDELAGVVRKGFADASEEIKAAIAEATAAITGNSGGYVVLHPAEHPQEILIMDSPDINTAVHVWRWNSAGLGYSSTGYNGTYGLAMTMNGAIVADFITVGTINGGLLQADSVQANAISAGFKQSITDSINLAKTTVEQEFKLADAELSSTIYESIASYNETGYTVDVRGLGEPNADSIMFWCEELGKNDIYYLDLTTGKLWTAGRHWHEQMQSWVIYIDTPPVQLEINQNCIQSQILQQGNEITAVVSSLQNNYYTKIETDSRITVSKDNILLTVSSAQSKYDEETYSIDIYGYGTPAAAGYAAGDYNGKYYLNQSKGDLYLSNGSVWSKVKTLGLITDTLQSEITANTTAISAKVSKGDVVSEINISTDTIRLSTAGRLIISAGNFQLDANGTATMSNANVSGIVTSGTTSDKMSKLDNGKLLLYANGDYCGALTGLKTISGQQTRTGIALAASSSLDGIVFGAGSENNDTITGYYWLNTSTNGYNQFNARHYFKDTVRLGNDLYIDGSCTSDLSFTNGQGIKLNGHTTVRYSNSKLLIGTTDETQLQGGTVNIVANDNVNINAGSNKMIYLQKPISVTGSITSSGSCSVGGSLSVSGSVTSDLSFSSDNGVKVNGNKVLCYSSSKVIVGNGNETTYVQGYSTQITSSNGTIISSDDDTQISAGTNKAIKMYKYTYFYYGAEIEDSYLTIANGYGIKTDGSVAIKYETSGTYNGLNVGVSNKPLRLWCSWLDVYGTVYISGETHLSDKIYLTNDKGIRVNGDNGAVTYSTSTGYLIFGNGNTTTYIQGANVYATSAAQLAFNSAGIMQLQSGGNINVLAGNSNDRSVNFLCSNVYINGSPVSTSSDQRQKQDITPLASKYLIMMKTIDPVSFKYNSDIASSGRRHTGFTAQDVLQAMIAAGIDTTEFAAFIDLHGDGSEYALRYEEFISPLLMYVQHLEGRIAALETERTA